MDITVSLRHLSACGHQTAIINSSPLSLESPGYLSRLHNFKTNVFYIRFDWNSSEILFFFWSAGFQSASMWIILYVHVCDPSCHVLHLLDTEIDSHHSRHFMLRSCVVHTVADKQTPISVGLSTPSDLMAFLFFLSFYSQNPSHKHISPMLHSLCSWRNACYI